MLMSDRRKKERAVELREQGDISAALDILEEMSGRQAESPLYLAALGHTYSEAGMTDEAIPCFREAVKLEPEHEMLSLALFHALWNAGRVQEAFREARRFLMRADSQDYRSMIGEMYAKWVK